jgi:small subunit ribosomal protein S17
MDSKKRILEGTVVSDKMDKTVVVEVTTLKTHKLYLKQYRTSQKYKAHDPNNSFKVGDVVKIMECRPISKDKKWRVVEAPAAGTK